jgi:hypothetical protein
MIVVLVCVFEGQWDFLMRSRLTTVDPDPALIAMKVVFLAFWHACLVLNAAQEQQDDDDEHH